MGTYSSRLGLFLPAGTDPADVQTIIDAWQKLDGTSGLILCTESTKPTTNNFPGKYIKCTDSGKHYYLDSTGSWSNGVYSGGSWIEDYYITAVTPLGGNLIKGASRTTPFVYTTITGGVDTDAGCSFNLALPSVADVQFDWDVAAWLQNNSVAVSPADVPNNFYFINWTAAGTGLTALEFSLYDGTTKVGSLGYAAEYASGSQVGNLNVLNPTKGTFFLPGVAAGSHTYSLRVRANATLSGGPYLAVKPSLVATVSA